jgi:mono/diheme cytochrome c family protein
VTTPLDPSSQPPTSPEPTPRQTVGAQTFPSPLTGEVRKIDQAHLLLLLLVVIMVISILAFVIVLPSRRPRADMTRQPYQKTYTPSVVFPDGMSERQLVSGVVPRPVDRSPGIPYVAVRVPGPANFPDVATTQGFPFPITREVLQRGQQRYNIYCSVCHGALGNGQGMIVQRGFLNPPSYFIQRLREAPDTHYYNVITNGYGAMFSYSDRVMPSDRWAIIAYIRALQLGVERSPDLSRELANPPQNTPTQNTSEVRR